MIDIFLRSGLANRMQVIASCVTIQEKFNEPFHYYWQKSDELNASFDQLFETIPGVDMHPANEKFKGTGIKYVRYLLIRLYSLIKYDQVFTEQNFSDLYGQGMDEFVSKLNRSDKNILWRLTYEFGANSDVYRQFKPIPAIQHQIDTVANRFNKDTVGIHIRRTDNKMAIKHSPIDFFYQKMDSLIDFKAKTNFFVSTDDLKVEHEIIQRYGERIIIQPDKITDRNTLKGMQQAVTDMYLLSRTQRIIGSFQSTFSIVSAKIGCIPLEIIKTN